MIYCLQHTGSQCNCYDLHSKMKLKTAKFIETAEFFDCFNVSVKKEDFPTALYKEIVKTLRRTQIFNLK